MSLAGGGRISILAMSSDKHETFVDLVRRHWWIVPIVGAAIGMTATAILWANDSFDALMENEAEARASIEQQISDLEASLIKRFDDQNTEVRSELAAQTRELSAISARQRDHFQQRESRFEELENEHKRIVDAVYQTIGDFHLELGRHQAVHELESAEE